MHDLDVIFFVYLHNLMLKKIYKNFLSTICGKLSLWVISIVVMQYVLDLKFTKTFISINLQWTVLFSTLSHIGFILMLLINEYIEGQLS